MLSRRLGRWSLRRVTTLDGYGAHSTPPVILAREGRLWFPTDDADGTVFMSIKTDGTDAQVHIRLSGAEAIVASPDLSKLAYRIGSDLFVTDLPRGTEPVEVETLDRIRAPGGVSQHMAWLADSNGLSWFEGNNLHIHRFSETEAAVFEAATPTAARASGDGVMALTNARVLTMAQDGEVIDNATIIIEDSHIVSVTTGTEPPPGAEVIDCMGMTIIPGLINIQAYAHEDNGAARPAHEWRYLSALDFGITTIHDTTTQTTAALPQAERAAIGLQTGPRVLATGTAVYGAQSSEEAHLHVLRTKASGAHSIKLDQRATRNQQRWYAEACRREAIPCVAAATDVTHAMALLIDGYNIIEGAIPYTPIHEDILVLWAQSEATIVPALLDTAGGLRGENYFFQQYSFVLEDPRLRRHYPRRMLDQTLLRGHVLARDWDWSFQARARDIETLRRNGAHIAIGNSGRMQGLGLHWEMWALASSGAMAPYAILQTATIHNARTLGLSNEIGSIEAGKRADLIVLTANPLDNIQNSTQIALVIHNGQLYE
jgi:imidazolonepropionase-like amidohydrolase